MKRCIIGLLVALLCTAGLAPVRAHMPDECAPLAHQAHERMVLYGDSLEELRRLPEAHLSTHLPEIRRAIQLSIDAIEAASAVVTCAMGEERIDEATAAPAPTTGLTEQGDWRALLEKVLVFAEEHEVALSISERCSAAYSEAVNGRSSSRPFLDVVSDWARAKQKGDEDLADAHHAVIISSVEVALSVHSEMQRLQIADRDRHVFTREYAEACRAAGIRELASQ